VTIRLYEAIRSVTYWMSSCPERRTTARLGTVSYTVSTVSPRPTAVRSRSIASSNAGRSGAMIVPAMVMGRAPR
jgi:hypothetical protein